LNDGVAQVLREEREELYRQQDFCLKHTRFVWLKSPQRLDAAQRERLQELNPSDLKAAQAWLFKERARDLWSFSDREQARLYWLLWIQSMMHSSPEPMQRVAQTLLRHLEELVNACVYGITNAVSEAFNRKIQWLKRQACGFRNVERFRRAIYFHLGKLDLYPRPEFHTNR